MDYAVMAKARRVVVVPSEVDWGDICSWQALSALQPADTDGNWVSGEAIVVNDRSCYTSAVKSAPWEWWVWKIYLS